MDTLRILLAGDSFGGERIHKGIAEVPFSKTWPEQVKAYFRDSVEITSDFKGYRRLVDCVEAFSKYTEQFDIIFVEAGIVDCFVRPLSLKVSKSPNILLKILRTIVRPIRKEWINYINSTKWSTDAELVEAIKSILKQGKEVYFINAAPIVQKQAINSPGAQEAIMDFNDLLRKLSMDYDNMNVLDLHVSLIKNGYKNYIHPIDSHLNQNGNDFLAQMVIQEIKSKK